MITKTAVKIKMNILLFLTGTFILSAAVTVFGQVSDADIQRQRREEQISLEREQKARAMITNSRPENPEDLMLEGERIRRDAAMRKLKEARRQQREKIIALRTPNPEDLTKYKEFLKQPKTGLFRLFPDLGCESKNLVRVDSNCANAVSFSSAYSFRQKDYVGSISQRNYDDSNFFDIRLKDENLIADGFFSQEILVSLGDMPLEDVSLASKGIKFLVNFYPETKIQEAKKQFKQIASIIEINGLKYGKIAQADLNSTYAVRIVAYQSNRKEIVNLLPLTTTDEEKFSNLQNDKRLDLTIAFRIIRKDSDGNMTILWKELAHQNAPKLIFMKDEEITDIK
jgi:hypothetical protein